MKKYVKPVTEWVEGTLALPMMLSLNDEIGDGQLVNSFDFEEEDDVVENTAWHDRLNIGF